MHAGTNVAEPTYAAEGTRMPAKNGREKGSKAEREVARMLEVWWQPVELARFVRTPMSGGWGDPRVRAQFKACGDVSTTASSFPFVVEVKRRERWSMRTLLGGQQSPVWSWWGQCQAAAREQGGEPLMLLRRSKMPWLAFLPADGRTALTLKAGAGTAHGLVLPDHPRLYPPWCPGEPASIYLFSRILAQDPRRFAVGRAA
jgi:hypothetical protein